MIKTIVLSVCLAASSLSLSASAQDTGAQEDRAHQDDSQYTEGPVTEVNYMRVEYGHFDEYIAWLDSTWKPTMEAMKKAGIIIDYKVYASVPVSGAPKSPDQANIIFTRVFKNMAALDKDGEQDEVAKKVICSTECQDKARVARNGYRKVLGIELIRELILK
ncbi:MAG: hypothetical protein ABSA49_15230 [Rhizomicrobium sp.]